MTSRANRRTKPKNAENTHENGTSYAVEGV